jgi:hypothetical protein
MCHNRTSIFSSSPPLDSRSSCSPASFHRLPYLAFLDLLAKGKVDAHVTKKFKGSDVYLK